MGASPPGTGCARMKKLAVAGALLLVAILLLAWMKGGTQPMRWIEQPVGNGSPSQ